MWFLRFIVTILVITNFVVASSPFEKLVNKFDDISEMREIFMKFVNLVFKQADYYETTSTMIKVCQKFNRSDENYVTNLIQETAKMNDLFNDISKQLHEALTIVAENFNEHTGFVLSIVMNDLLDVSARYDELLQLQRDLAEVSDRIHLKEKINKFRQFAFSKSNNELELIKFLTNIHWELFDNRGFKDLTFEIQDYYSDPEEPYICSNYERVQDQLFASYLQLVAAEIKGFIVFVYGHFYNGFQNIVDDNEVEKMAEDSLTRIADYIQLIRNTIDRIGPNCECEEQEIIEAEPNHLGKPKNFYPLVPSRILTFFTNLTKHICVHLSNGPSHENIIFEICLGEEMNTVDVIRVRGETNMVVDIDNPNRFNQSEFHKLIFRLNGQSLIVFHEKSHGKHETLINTYQHPDFEYITNYALTSPHNDKNAYTYIVNALAVPSGFSQVIKGIKSCWCKINIADDIDTVHSVAIFTPDPIDSSKRLNINVCMMNEPSGAILGSSVHYTTGKSFTWHPCKGFNGLSDSPITIVNEIVPVLAGCVPEMRLNAKVSATKALSVSLVGDEVVFSYLCRFLHNTSDAVVLGVYTANTNHCRAFLGNETTSKFQILYI